MTSFSYSYDVIFKDEKCISVTWGGRVFSLIFCKLHKMHHRITALHLYKTQKYPVEKCVLSCCYMKDVPKMEEQQQVF